MICKHYLRDGVPVPFHYFTIRRFGTDGKLSYEQAKYVVEAMQRNCGDLGLTHVYTLPEPEMKPNRQLANVRY